MCCGFVEYCNVACLFALCGIVACDLFVGRVPTSKPTLTLAPIVVCFLLFVFVVIFCVDATLCMWSMCYVFTVVDSATFLTVVRGLFCRCLVLACAISVLYIPHSRQPSPVMLCALLQLCISTVPPCHRAAVHNFCNDTGGTLLLNVALQGI
jgi:hypothetical protein